jgi:hypothetical protein
MSIFGEVASVRRDEVLMASSWCVGFAGRCEGCGRGGGLWISVTARMWWRPWETCFMAMKVKTPGWGSQWVGSR